MFLCNVPNSTALLSYFPTRKCRKVFDKWSYLLRDYGMNNTKNISTKN